jgi:hypothetical protein
MPESVAVEADVKATVGAKNFSDNATGTWSAGTVTHKTYPKLKVGAKAVIYESSCTFSYSGADNSSGATVTGSSTVTLTATNKLTQKRANFVLVNGDSANDSFGNTLKVEATGFLKSD